jgi:cytoskeletal protein RodZ
MANDDETFEIPPRRTPGPPPFSSPHTVANEEGGIDIPPLRETAEEDENRRAHSRSRYSSFFAAAAMAAVLMGGAFWWGFEVGRQNALEEEPPVERADLSPIKEAPIEPSGLQVPHQDVLVLRNIEDDDGVDAPVTLASAPEQPGAPAPRLVEPDVPSARAVETTQLPPPPLIRETGTLATVRPPPQTIAPVPAAAPPPLIPATSSETPAAPEAMSLPTASTLPQRAAVQPTPAVAQVATSPANVGVFRVQLAAYRSPNAAATGWQTLQTRYEDLLGTLESTVVQVNLGERGVFHRLQAGPYTSRATADNACTALRARNQACLVVSP